MSIFWRQNPVHVPQRVINFLKVHFENHLRNSPLKKSEVCPEYYTFHAVDNNTPKARVYGHRLSGKPRFSRQYCNDGTYKWHKHWALLMQINGQYRATTNLLLTGKSRCTGSSNIPEKCAATFFPLNRDLSVFHLNSAHYTDVRYFNRKTFLRLDLTI